MTSRRDELANLRDDLQDRLTRGRAGAVRRPSSTWEAIQRIELCDSARPLTRSWTRRPMRWAATGADLLRRIADGQRPDSRETADAWPSVPGVGALGDLSTLLGPGPGGSRSAWGCRDSPLAADIAFRYLQRLSRRWPSGWNGWKPFEVWRSRDTRPSRR